MIPNIMFNHLNISYLIVSIWICIISVADAGKFTFKGLMTIADAKTPQGELIGKVEVGYKLDAYMQEPIKVFEMRYFPKVKNTTILGNVKFRARVYSGKLATEAYITFTPATPPPNKNGYDFPGSPDWKDLFHTIDGKPIKKSRAVELYKKGDLTLRDLTILKAKIRNSKIKSERGDFDYDKYVNRGFSRAANDAPMFLEKSLAAVGEGWSEPYMISDMLKKGNFSLSKHKSTFFDEKQKKWRNFEAVRLSLRKLPAANKGGKALDYARVTFFINSDITKEFKVDMKVGDVWSGLFEIRFPATGVGPRMVFATRAVEKEESDDKEEKGDDSKDPFDQLANNKEKNNDDGMKSPDSDFPNRKSDASDPFSRRISQKQKEQKIADNKRREAEVAKGVTSKVYMVVRESIVVHKGSCQAGLFLSNGNSTKKSKEAFWNKVHAAVRAGKSLLIEDHKRLETLVKQTYGAHGYVNSEPFALDVTQRPREPFKLTERESQQLSQWNRYRKNMLSFKGALPEGNDYDNRLVSFRRNFCQIVTEEFYFHSIEEAQSFLKGKPTKKIANPFKIKN